MISSLDQIVSLCKRRGFVFPGSSLYGGLANSWDYGPYGAALKKNIKDLWWQTFVERRSDIYGLDGSIILSPKVWEASGHVARFTDPVRECSGCHKRFRTDKIGEETKKCPECGQALGPKTFFNPMFKTYLGVKEDKASLAYLRPETAQAIFINFKNVIDACHPRLPFGIAQMGKSFRNEITAGNFIFRTLEFEQMEIEYFIHEKDWEETFNYWLEQMLAFAQKVGIKKDHLKTREHPKEELSHYSKKTVDIEYLFPFGQSELYGLAYRTDYDLKNHSEKSGVDLSYQDPKSGEKFFPHVVEPSFGLERTILALLLDAYHEEEVRGEKRTVLRLAPPIAPVKVAVFPLLANKEDLVKEAKRVFKELAASFISEFDDIGNIGKRYRRQDEIGTPWCVTIDFDTLKDNTVTVRDRDTMKQERVKINSLNDYFEQKLKNENT
jgi:glycyl-tRNA synthetase